MVKTLASPLMIIARYAASLIVIALLWHLGSISFGTEILPRPLDTAALFCRSLGDPEYLSHLSTSAWRLVLGLICAAVIALPLGIMLGHCRRADAWGSPLVFITYPLPKIVLLPVFFVLLGLGESSRVTLICLTAGYQILVIVRDVAKRLNPVYAEAVRYMGATRLELLRHVYLPAALPGFFTGLKVSAGTAVAVLFLAESFATDRGLGYLIMDAWGIGDTLAMFNGIMGMAALGLCVYAALWALERLLCPGRRRG